MTLRISHFFLLLAIVAAFCPTKVLVAQQASAAPSVVVGPKAKPGEILVRFRPGVSRGSALSLHSSLNARVISESKLVSGLNRVRIPTGTSLARTLRSYRQDSRVLYAEPNYIVHALGSPNDPLFSTQWNLQNTGQWGGLPGADIHAVQAWGITTGSANVAVGVIDTGADYTHPDLGANIWTAPKTYSVTDALGNVDTCPSGSRGFNMVLGTCDPFDDNGHGTHVSGIIGAVGNNGIGVVGINWQVQIIPCKFLDSTGSGDVSGAIACLAWMKSLHDSGIPIIATNNSWGGGLTSQALADAISAQAADGILFVAAAGNAFSDNDVATEIPAGIFSSNIIAVAATTNQDTLAAFSDIGSHSVHVGAPGQEVLSTLPGNTYDTLSGTSMAAPHVTGLAALLKAANPSLDWRAIHNLILTGGDPVPALSQTVSGRRLDAHGSLTCSGATLEKRLLPTVDVLAATIGQPVNLAVTNINCGTPAGSVQVTVQPGGQTITLSDDGKSPDQTAGDGIYTGLFTPQALDNYVLTFPSGDQVQIEVLNNYEVGETSYSYRTITGTSLNLGDDAIGTISAPFPVHFGGATFDTVYVSSNGTLSFTNKFDDYAPERIPVDYWSQNPMNGPAPAIYQPVVTLFAPWWQDLTPILNSSHNVFWDINGTAPNRELVIEWRDLPSFECADDLSSTVKFQVVLSESTDNIVSNYADTKFGGACGAGDLGVEAEIGIQVSQTTGTEWGSGTTIGEAPVVDGMALLWSIPPANQPPNPVPTILSISPSTLNAGSGDTWVTLTGTDFIPNTLVQFYPGFNQPTIYVSSTEVQFLVTAAELVYPAFMVQVNAFNPAPGGGFSNAVYYDVNAAAVHTNSTSPTSVPAGSFGFILTVKGSNFLGAGDLMFDDGVNSYLLQPVSTTGTQIQAIVPDYAVRTARSVKVYLATGNGNSNKVTFNVTAAAGGFFAPPPSQTSQGQSSQSSTSPPAPPFPHQFLGWNQAEKQGGKYLQQFLRPRADLAPDLTAVTMSGVRSLSGAAAPASSLPLPGIAFRPTIPADFLPTAVVAGDFNGDGKKDWAVANGGSNNIWIYLGKGDGTSQIPTIKSLRGFTPIAMAAADMNGDGNLDLVVVEADSGAVAVLLGNGDGTFQPERITYVPGAPLCLAVADFDGDGHPDVVVGLAVGIEGSSLAFLAGDGKGSLGLPSYHFGSSFFAETVGIAAGDLNGDGLPDIVIVQFDLSHDGLNLFEQMPNVGASVYINAGGGSFKPIQVADPDHTTDQIGFFGHAVTAVALGDVNHDGCLDLVAVDQVGLADYLPGLCNGTFDTANMQTIGTGVPAASAALADLNRDGKLDLVVGGFHFNDNFESGASAGDAVSVSLGNGDGTFTNPALYRGEPAVYSLAFADLNGDGYPEIITANQDSDSASVYTNNGKGGFGTPSGAYLGYLTGGIVHGTINTPKTSFAFADANGDGHNDLLFFEWPLLSYQATNIAVMLGDGAGNYAAPVRSDVLHTDDTIVDFVVGDFRNTGRSDILALVYNSIPNPGWSFAELQNAGNSSFAKATYPVSNAGNLWPSALVIGDFNKDGNLDVAVMSYANTSGVSIVPFLGHGDGTFTEGTPVAFSGSPNLSGMVSGDFDHDGKLDLLFLQDGSLYLLAGNGDGTFKPERLLFQNFNYFTAGDLNGDGILDLVEVVPTTPNSNGLGLLEYAVYLGQVGGNFVSAGTYGPYQGLFTRDFLGGTLTDPTQVAHPFVADFNGDGKLDIAAYQTSITGQAAGYVFETGPGSTTLTFLLGNGDGTFTPTYLGYGLERYFVPQLLVDTNGDGRADLVQLDAITSSYHTITGSSGPSFAVGLVSDPILGSDGTVRITLALPSASGTTVQLTSSDPNITLPSSVSIPAGSFRTDVPFQIGSSFNSAHVFQIQAQVGTEVHAAYGTKASSSQVLGFAAGLNAASWVVLAALPTPDYGLVVGSIGGYATEINLSCQGLPAGAACQFEANPLDLSPGTTSISTLTVSTPAGLAVGSYPFTVQLSDGNITQQVQASFKVGDFSVSAPANQFLLSTRSTQALSITVTGINSFNGPITISCNTGLPSGLKCPWDGAQLYAIGNYPTYVDTQGLAPGTYQWTITGTVGSVSHSSTVPLYVFTQTPSISGSVSPPNATISAGSSASFSVNLQSQNGTAGPFAFSCASPPSNLSCSFNPGQIDLQANASGNTTLTIAVNAKRTVASNAPLLRRSWPLGLLLAGCLVMWVGNAAKKDASLTKRAVSVTLAFLLACFAGTSTSCGGGGSSSPPPPPPPPTYNYYTINVQTSGPGINTTVGTVTIAVPQ